MQIESQRKPPFGVIDLHSPKHFVMSGIGGALACSFTHWVTTPIDVAKCNMQARPEIFKDLFHSLKIIYSGQLQVEGYRPGLRGLFKGWSPTLLGYGGQGFLKFGLYEVFEHWTQEAVGKETAFENRRLIHLTSSASAEFFGDLILCPFEAVKVQIQIRPSYASGLHDGIPKMISKEGIRSLFSILGPVWGRQIPYTCTQFIAFEETAEIIYRIHPLKKSDLSKFQQLLVVIASGYVAGLVSGAVSHPADTIVSKMKAEMVGGVRPTASQVLKKIGFKGVWKGFWPRAFQIGTMSALQFLIVGSFKVFVGLPIPGKDAEELQDKIEQ